MKILDLFCGGGGSPGAGVPGVEWTGVDTVDFSGVYPGRFVLGDALTWGGLNPGEFDAIVASPPCEEFARAWLPWKRCDKSPAPWAVACLAWAVREAGRRRRMVVECSRFGSRHVAGAWVRDSWALWGAVPLLLPEIRREKQKIWGGRGGHVERAKIPPCLARAVVENFKRL